MVQTIGGHLELIAGQVQSVPLRQTVPRSEVFGAAASILQLSLQHREHPKWFESLGEQAPIRAVIVQGSVAVMNFLADRCVRVHVHYPTRSRIKHERAQNGYHLAA